MIVKPLASRRMGNSRDTRIVRVGQNALAPSLPMPNPIVPRVGQAYPAVGQMSLGCPTFPSTMKYLSATTGTLAPGASETLEFTTPGAFYPVKMILTASVDVNDVEVVHVISGLEDQIITGEVPGGLFSIANNCCPVSCLKGLCSPGVPLRVTVTNDDAMSQTVTVTLVGAYLDACPPNGAPYDLPVIPGCPYPGSDKLVGFSVDVLTDASASVEITTPGKFCPRGLFLAASIDLSEITIESIKSGLKDQIISGELPADLFGIDNECCVLACFDCLCAPGYPLTLTFHNTDAMTQTVRGALIGTYTDACP